MDAEYGQVILASPREITNMITWDQFLSVVDSKFGYLTKDFGFTLSSTVRPFATFESDKLKVSIYYDLSGSCELDVALRRIGDDPKRTKSVGIGVLKAFNEQSKSSAPMISFPKTLGELEARMTMLAGVLLVYGNDLLKGDLKDLETLRRKEAQAARALAIETSNRLPN
jgi:hypothetical protein